MNTKIIASVVLFAVSFLTGKLAEKLFPFKDLMDMVFKPAKA